MAGNDQKPGENRTESKAGDSAQPASTASAAAAQPQIVPRISDYYAGSKMKAAAFAKAVSKAKVRSFDPADVAKALRSFDDADPMLARTAGLLGSESDSIREWVDETAKTLLRRTLGEGAEGFQEPADTLFDGFIRQHIGDLVAKDKQRRTRAQNLLRLVLVWLLQRRNLSPLTALLSIAKIKRKKESAGTEALARGASRLLKRAKMRQLFDFALVASLSEMSVVQAANERQAALSLVVNLRERIATLEARSAAAADEIVAANADRERLSAELAVVQKAFAESRELRALDHTQQVARFRGFLTSRLMPPLSDARDALGFDPPQVDAASQRIEMAIEAIGRGLKEINA